MPDCMFIRKTQWSDWLDSGTWAIYTFPYRRSGPFIRFSIKVKTQDFWEDDRETINRTREKLVTFEKLSVNFRNFLGKTWNDRLLHLHLHSAETFPNMFWKFQSGNKLFNNWLDCLYERYESLGPSYRPLCGRSVRQNLELYIFPCWQSNQLLRSYFLTKISTWSAANFHPYFDHLPSTFLF